MYDETFMLKDVISGIIKTAFVVVISAIISFLVVLNHKAPDKPQARVIYSGTPVKLIINGQDKGCRLDGIDDQGFWRWEVVPCPQPSPLTKGNQPVKIYP